MWDVDKIEDEPESRRSRRRSPSSIWVLLFVAVPFVILLAFASRNAGVGDVPKRSDELSLGDTTPPPGTVAKRCLSLRVLQTRLQSGDRDDGVPQLCGITFLEGFLVDEKSGDVILFGSARPELPPLLLDDLVVALRNAWSDSGSPGCSIDPEPSTMVEINQALDAASQANGIQETRRRIRRLLDVGRQPQKVRVIRVPPDSHFLKVLVDADYRTKTVADGTRDPDIPGLVGLVRDAMAANKDAVEKSKARPCQAILSRFWFTPGRLSLVSYSMLTELRACQVRLLTEREYATESGQLVGANKAEPFSQVFTERFTDRYEELCAAVPVYRELSSMFRFMAIAKAMRHSASFSLARLDSSWLLSQYKIASVRVDKRLPGVANVLEDRVSLAGGKEILLWMMSVGGVDIPIDIDSSNCVAAADRGDQKRMTDTARAILDQRPGSNTLAWNTFVPANPLVSVPRGSVSSPVRGLGRVFFRRNGLAGI